jgi:di/tricarboxylate transporter
MTFDQAYMIGVLAVMFTLFVWGRLRYDVVAILALLGTSVAGLVPADAAFTGFGHPATVTVALVLVVSRGLMNAGAVDIIARRLVPPAESTALHVGMLATVGGAISTMMNNVGALALLMPAALRSAARVKRSPSLVLMPLAFATILGGLVTMIGTPPNIIVATMRGDLAGAPFAMFDFTPVGGPIAVAGIAFVALIGWRLIPKERTAPAGGRELFQIEDYVSEALVPEGSPLVGKELTEVDDLVAEHDAAVLGLMRGDRRIDPGARHTLLRAGDALVIEAGPDALKAALAKLGLEPAGPPKTRKEEKDEKTPVLLGGKDIALAEAVVQPGAIIVGRTGAELRLRRRFGVNLLAVSRQGAPFRGRLAQFRFRPGDVLLLEGESLRLPEVVGALGCLPLAERGLQANRFHYVEISIVLFAAAIIAATTGVLSFPVALGVAVLVMVVLDIVPPRDIYTSIDWPVVVLIGALIPVGQAMQDTGTTLLIAETLTAAVGQYPPVVALAAVLVVTMTLSDIINNAATAVIMAPIGASVAEQLGANADTFLMAVAVGASCAFLTPIGHQNNTLILGPGGYRFGDYWRMGLPLEITIIAVAIPALLWAWPLGGP